MKGQNLYSYMIMPIQRPPRYEMLLSELLRYTADTHPDHNNIKNAHQLVIEINLHVDEKKRLDENKRKVLEIDRLIVGGKKHDNLVAPHRVFVREGDLTSDTNTFRVYLFNDICVICRAHHGSHRRGTTASSDPAVPPPQLYDQLVALPLLDAAVTDVSSEGVAQFKLSTSEDTSFLLSCGSPAECEAWVKDIAANIVEQEESRPRTASNSANVRVL